MARESSCSDFTEVKTEVLRGKLTCLDNEHVRDRVSIKVHLVSLLGIPLWTEFCPLKQCVEVLTLGTVNVTLFRIWSLWR